jgi:hypothetical protein
MSIRLASLLLLVCASTAFAEPAAETLETKSEAAATTNDKFVAASYTAGGKRNYHRGVSLEAAHRFGGTAGFMRGELAVGVSDDDGGPHPSVKGYFEQLMIGVEVRGSGHTVRGFGGFDLGLQIDHRTPRIDEAPMSEMTSHFVTMPRLGLEAGTRFVWVRAALSFPIRTQLAGPEYTTDNPFIEVIGDLGVGVGF